MSKVQMRTLESVTGNDAAATALINQNFKDLQDAIDNTVSRDGSTPNYMDADFDLNNKRLINLADPVDDHDAIHKKYFTDTIGDAASYATAAAVSANSAASSAQSAAVSAATAIAELQAAEAVINAAVANAVNTAAGQAQSDIANYVNTTVEPSLQNSVNAAYNYSLDSYNYANSASNSANASYNYSLASYSYSNNSSGFANNSSNSASASLGYANSASNYANNSSNYANSSSNYANNANVWAEGTDVEVTALGGEHSAKGWAQSAAITNKADKDLGNITASGTSFGACWAMPGDVYDNLTLGTSGSYYTAPANGYVYFNKSTNASNQEITITVGDSDSSSNNYSVKSSNPVSGTRTIVFVPVKKGQKFWITYTTAGSTNCFRFYYAVGSESEAI